MIMKEINSGHGMANTPFSHPSSFSRPPIITTTPGIDGIPVTGIINPILEKQKTDSKNLEPLVHSLSNHQNFKVLHL